MVNLSTECKQSPLQALEFATGLGFIDRAAVHFDKVESSGDCVAYAGGIGGGGGAGQGQDGEPMEILRPTSCRIKLALQVRLRHFDVAQGHANILVTQQLHENRETDAETDHFRRIAVATIPGPE